MVLFHPYITCYNPPNTNHLICWVSSFVSICSLTSRRGQRPHTFVYCTCRGPKKLFLAVWEGNARFASCGSAFILTVLVGMALVNHWVKSISN